MLLVTGAVLGGVAGHATEQQAGRQAGIEIALKPGDGRLTRTRLLSERGTFERAAAALKRATVVEP